MLVTIYENCVVYSMYSQPSNHGRLELFISLQTLVNGLPHPNIRTPDIVYQSIIDGLVYQLIKRLRVGPVLLQSVPQRADIGIGL